MAFTTSIQNLRMGVASITVNGINVGNTLGGTKATITRKLTPLKADKYGDSNIDMVLTDEQMVIAGKIAEPVVLAIAQILPESALNIGTAGNQLGIGAGEGTSFRGGAALVVLHPLSKAVSDQSEDVTMYLGVPSASPVLNYEVANQRVFDYEFTALVSEAYQPGRRLGHIGPVNIS